MNEDSEYTVVITGSAQQFHRIRNLVHFLAVQQGVPEQEADIIERAVAEACHNALFHEPEEKDNPSFELELRLSDLRFTAIVRNRGAAFDFDDVAPFSINQDFMSYSEGGLGIPMMKRLMDDVSYERKSGSLNEVTLVKHINGHSKEEE